MRDTTTRLPWIKGVFAMAREQDRLRAEVRRLRDAIGAVPRFIFAPGAIVPSLTVEEEEVMRALAEIAKEGEQ